jgi:hypothetical protein
MNLLFCKIGLHWKMKIVESLFTSVNSGRTVFDAVCPCGKHWMTDEIHGYPFFKVRLERRDEK